MTGLERLGWGRVWILETLFQVAEEHDCMVGDFRFMPTSNGELLFFSLNGKTVSWTLSRSEIEDFAKEEATKVQILSSRVKAKQRLRELLMIHRPVIPVTS